MRDTKSSSILLAGGGYVLTQVANLLPAESFIITSRQPEKRDSFAHQHWDTALLDFSNPASFANLFAKNSALKVVVDSVPPAQEWTVEETQKKAQERGRLFRDAGIQEVLYLSTTGVFGVDDGSVVNESTTDQPKTMPAQKRLATEQGYQAAGVKLCSLRIPAIYGPGRGLTKALQRGNYYLIDGGTRWTNRIHRDDLAAGIVALLGLNQRPARLCVADDYPTLQREVVNFYCSRFGLPLPSSISKQEADAKGLHTMLSNQRVSNAEFKKFLGGELRYPSFWEGAETENR